MGVPDSMIASNAHVAEATATTEAEMRPQSVPVNVYAATEALVIVAPMPAVIADDVCVELRPGDPPTLRFWAHVRSAAPREYLLHEWEYGGYERQLDLPAGYGGGVEARLQQRSARGAGPARRLHRAGHSVTVLSTRVRVPSEGLARSQHSILGWDQPRLLLRG